MSKHGSEPDLEVPHKNLFAIVYHVLGFSPGGEPIAKDILALPPSRLRGVKGLLGKVEEINRLESQMITEHNAANPNNLLTPMRVVVPISSSDLRWSH